MDILSIGNSFSQDATRYIHGIARADGETVNTANLYIGGCPLEKHFRNMHTNEKAYELQYNGSDTGFFVSLDEALLNRSWDVVTLQQKSADSFDYDTFTPYISSLAAHVRKLVPKARIFVHQTWSYEVFGERIVKRAGTDDPWKILDMIVSSYAKAAKEINADGLIPSGELFKSLFDHGIKKLHRDKYHATLGCGRYALGLLWYRVICGKSVLGNTFRDFDEAVGEKEIKTVKKCVEAVKVKAPEEKEPRLKARRGKKI